MILSDESAEKRLLIDLVDRDIISAEAVQKYWGFVPSLEKGKIRREYGARKGKNIPPKASPYHQAQQDFEYKKILLQNGDITPGEADIELSEKKAGEQTRQELTADLEVKKLAMKPKPVGTKTGRPKNTIETKKRKPKPNFKPRTTANYNNLVLWSNRAYSYISENLSDFILSNYGKKNFRQLSSAEAKEVEDFKFNVLAALEPLCELNKDTLMTAIEKSKNISPELVMSYVLTIEDFTLANKREPNTDERRQLQILTYVGAKIEHFTEKSV
jgi:hypothetical protein